MTLMQPEGDLIAYAFVERGVWMAECPRKALGCRNAEHFGADAVTGHVGGLTETAFRCNHCGVECPAQWPRERDAIERVLAQRPVPMTRCWKVGEPVRDLIAENVEHGLLKVRNV